MLAVLPTYIQGVCNIHVPERTGLLLFTSSSSFAGRSSCAVCRSGRKSRKGNCSTQSDEHLRCGDQDDVIDGPSGVPCLDSDCKRNDLYSLSLYSKSLRRRTFFGGSFKFCIFDSKTLLYKTNSYKTELLFLVHQVIQRTKGLMPLLLPLSVISLAGLLNSLKIYAEC